MKSLQEKLKFLPKQPGIYEFLGKDGEVLYVGKAKNLKARVGQYFQNHDNRPQLPYLMAEAVDVNYTVVDSELESAFLENTLIKQHKPKYNIDLRDDKNYAFIKIDYSTEIPQIGYARKIEDSYRRHSEEPPSHQQGDEESQKKRSFPRPKAGVRMTPLVKYFGPYTAAYKIRNTLNLVRKIFPFCAASKVSSRPCFYYYMHRCPGVCIGKISIEEYKNYLLKIAKFLQGDISEITRQIKTEMASAAKAKKFEAAARLRDQLRTLELLQEKQNVILPKKVDWDIVSLGTSDGFACINLFKVREGKLFDKENFVYELGQGTLTPAPLPLGEGKVSSLGLGGEGLIIQRFLEQYYIETSSRPQCVYLQIQAEDAGLVAKILQSRFAKKTEISVPQKGKVAKLINLGKLNAEEYLRNWLNDRAGNLDKISQALLQLKEVLGLPLIPKRIECYDISNIQGTNPVGSMVVFKDGLPAKSEYRKFKIQGKKTPDDFAMMKEMLQRRFSRSLDDPKWSQPDLVVIDGGKGQLSVAVKVLPAVTVIGLAKRIEEIFLPNKNQPIILPHDQPALQLLQRLRDEAHRFGITFHRKLRSKQAIKSALDDIPGLGPKTKKLLKINFGTVANVRNAGQDELAKIVGQRLAQIIKSHL